MKKKLLAGFAAAALLAVTASNPEVSAQSRYNYNSYGYNNYGYNTRNNYWNYGYSNNYNTRNNYWNYGYNNSYGYNNRYNNNYGWNNWNGNYGWNYDYDYNYGWNNNYNNNYSNNGITYYNGRYWYTDRNNVTYYYNNGQWVRYVEANNNTNNIVYYNGRYWYTDSNNVSYYWSNGQWVRFVEETTEDNDYFYYEGRYYKLDANNKYLVWENGQWVPLEEDNNDDNSSSEESSESSNEVSEESSEVSEESSVVSEESSEVSSEVSEASSEVSSEVSEVSSESSSEVSEVSSESASESSSEVSSESSSSIEDIFPGLESSSSESSEPDFVFPGRDESSSESSSSVESSSSASTSSDRDYYYNESESIPREGYENLPEAVRPPGTPFEPSVYNDERYRYSDGTHYFVIKNEEGVDLYYWMWLGGRWYIKTNTDPNDPGLNPDVHSSITEEGYNYDETVSPKLFSEVNVGTGKAGQPLPFKTVEEFRDYVIKNYAPVFKDNQGNDLKVRWAIDEGYEEYFKNNVDSAFAGRYVLQANITGFQDWEWGWVNFVYEVKGFEDETNENIEYGYEDESKAKEAFAIINAAREAKGLAPLEWDAASYQAGIEILQERLKNWDSSGPIERRIPDASTVANKWVNFIYTDQLLSPDLKTASVSYLVKADGNAYWYLNIGQ